MSRSKRSRCTTSRARCIACSDLKQANRRAREVEPSDKRAVCTCGWITALAVCPMCGLERVPEAA